MTPAWLFLAACASTYTIYPGETTECAAIPPVLEVVRSDEPVAYPIDVVGIGSIENIAWDQREVENQADDDAMEVPYLKASLPISFDVLFYPVPGTNLVEGEITIFCSRARRTYVLVTELETP